MDHGINDAEGRHSAFYSRQSSVRTIVEHGTNATESRRSGSFSRASSENSSLRRHSSSLSFAVHPQIDDDIESETVSEAGDIGDRALHRQRHSDSGRLFLPADHVEENGVVVPIPEDIILQPSGFWSRDSVAIDKVSPVSPTTFDIISPISTDGILLRGGKKASEMEMPGWLEYTSCLTFLALFGILGVLTRYGLQRLFGPGVIGATSEESYMYLDLPSNMVGSFLMGWLGVVFKGDISKISEQLAIGLSTGYLGSLTTFSGWNQKMLNLSAEGHWVFAVLGILVGLFLVAYSIIFGIETARGAKWVNKLGRNSNSEVSNSQNPWKLNSCKHHLVMTVVLLLLWASMWSMSIALVVSEFERDSSKAELWLACIVGPFGVWIRWFLARLNGRGLGKLGLLKWVPFGTLIANVSAACVMAVLETLRSSVNTKRCNTVVTGIQLGLLGCLSTVSTFIAEFHAMRQSKHPWRAYVYAMSTILISFVLGTLIYSVPVWAKGFHH